MTKRELRRLKIFRKFSNQLHLLVENGFLNIELKYQKTYICPICLRQFEEKDIYSSDTKNFLTEEDAPPEKLNGRRVALTCKECNSTAGAEIDVHLINRKKLRDISEHFPESNYSGQIPFDGKQVNATISRDGSGILEINYQRSNNNPELLERYIQSIKKGQKLNVKPKKLKNETDRVNQAMLKSSYILTFANFGYIFLLHTSYDIIRKQIKSDFNDFEYQIFTQTPHLKDKIDCYYMNTSKYKGILNVMNFKSKFSETFVSSILPLPGVDCKKFYESLVETGNNLTNGKIMVGINVSKIDRDKDNFTDLEIIKKIYNWKNAH